MVTLEEFKKTELKVATVEAVNPHPNADRLYVLSIKVGEIRKTIVAGIRLFYAPEQLVGKQIVIVDNLEPCVIRGVESQGMLLAASNGENLTVITTDRPIEDGACIK